MKTISGNEQTLTDVNVILTLPDVIRETADRFLNDVSSTFRKSIRPVYRVSRAREIPEQIGTCTLLEIGCRRLIVTAAHVADHQAQGSLYIGGERLLVELTDRMFQTPAPDGDRDNDYLDFAICNASADLLGKLGDISFVTPDLFANCSYPPSADRLYVCLGFPNSKNKDIHVGTQSVKTTLWRYCSYAVAPPPIAGYPTSDEHHLFIDFNKKRARNAAGGIVITIWPQGASGGPIFEIGDFSDRAIVFPDCVCRPKLAGILIQKPKLADAIMCVRLQVVVGALRRNGFI